MSEFQRRLEANIRESLRFAVGEVDEEAVAHMIAGVNAVLDHPSAPAPSQHLAALKLSERLADQVDHCLLGYAISRQNGLSIDDAMLQLRVACDEFRAALATTEGSGNG